MSTPSRIRQGHRWVAVMFLAVVAANFVVFALPDPPEWVAYLALLPLLLLATSGIYLLILPHRRSTTSGDATP